MQERAQNQFTTNRKDLPMKSTENTINFRLRILRKRILKLTQHELASKIGYQSSTVSMVENEIPPYNGRVSTKFLLAIANTFNVRVGWLTNGTGPVFNKKRAVVQVRLNEKDHFVETLSDNRTPQNERDVPTIEEAPIVDLRPVAEEPGCSMVNGCGTNVVLALCKCLACTKRCKVVSIARLLVKSEEARLAN